MTASKIQLRKQFNAKRAAFTPHEREAAARSAAVIFTALPLFIHNRRIACYLSFKDEFDAAPLIEAIWQAKKICYVPVLSPQVSSSNERDLTLQFVRYNYGDALRLNRFGILEPAHPTEPLPPEQLEVVITPLVAFDHLGHRLGMGGGYYDRTFKFLREAPSDKPGMLGLAYAAQEAENLPIDEWDITLSGVITEKRFFSF